MTDDKESLHEAPQTEAPEAADRAGAQETQPETPHTQDHAQAKPEKPEKEEKPTPKTRKGPNTSRKKSQDTPDTDPGEAGAADHKEGQPQNTPEPTEPRDAGKPTAQRNPQSQPANTNPADPEKPAEEKERKEQKEEKPPREPETVRVNDLLKLSHEELLKRVAQIGGKSAPNRTKVQLIMELARRSFANGDLLEATGIYGYGPDGHGQIFFEEQNFLPTALDIYVSQNFIQRYKLKPGLKITGRLHAPKERDKRLALDQIIEIEGVALPDWETPTLFDNLTALHPKERIILETPEEELVDGRVVDLIAPLGKGQRGLVVAPPRVGKTILLKHIARCIRKNHPEIELLILLVDERPEEVTDMKREVDGSVYSSTFDENNYRHIQVAELVMERAKRLVEMKRDVVILLDSLTRLARGYNNQTGNKGRLLSGGIDPKALQKAGKFFSMARNAEEGGSLTLLASVLVDTGSKLDQVIFEEFKGKGNMEVYLDRSLVEKRIFPGVHIIQSGTRKEDLLYHPDELQRVHLIRKQLNTVPAIESMQTLLKNIERTKSNTELILSGLR